MPASQSLSPRRFFVSRHPGAIEWAKRYHWSVRTLFVPHLDVAAIAPGDVVIGNLPVHLAAKVCALGARYLHLTVDLLEHQRGAELSADQMEAAGAHLVAYRILIDNDAPGPQLPHSGQRHGIIR